MKMLMKLIALAAIIAAMPLYGQTAWAADAGQPQSANVTLNGPSAPAPAGLLASANAKPQSIVVAGRRGRYLGPAIVGGIVAGALIAGAARAHKRDYYYSRRRYVHRCDKWLWRCEDGYRRACRKFYRYCD